MKSVKVIAEFFFLFVLMFIFIYVLGSEGLTCGMWDLAP